MIGVNPLRTKVLITTDEVIFHAPTEHSTDPRVILQNIIVAERRFIKPMVGASIYNTLNDNKNLLVTSANKSALETAVNTGRGPDREPIVLVPGDYVNSDTYLNDYQQDLWHNYLHKIVAECVYFSSLPVNRARFTSKGIVKNNPENITQAQESVTVDLKDLKHLMDKTLLERISPLMDDLHRYMCDTAYPGYTRDCGCKSTGYGKQSGVLFGLYDDDDKDCCKESYTSSTAITAYGKNETIPFTNVDTVIIPWSTARKTKFGAAGTFTVEVLEEDGLYHVVSVDIVPDNITNTTFYTIDLAGVATGRVIIS